MSKSYTGSPVPLRPVNSDPLFKEGDNTYVVKATTPMEHQRSLDGTQHSMNRPSSLVPKGIDIFLSEDKIDKSASQPAPKAEPIDVDAVIKSFMERDEEEEDDIKKKKPKLGSGERFKQLSGKLSKKGVEDPKALAAAIGRKNYGKKKFQKLAAKGK